MVKLTQKNKATDIRRELMVEVLKCFFEDRPGDLDRLPVKLYPRTKQSYRCCIHKDRYIVRNRIIAILGHNIEGEDETKTLKEHLDEALARKKVEEPVLTFIGEACSSCIVHNYFVTDACRGCVARPCTVNCPKKAITVEGHKSRIDPEKCVTCGICQKVCPYNAIVYIPIPCEEGCPVGAIKKADASGKHYIDYGLCIYCGKCTRNCPFSAIVEKTQLIDVARRLKAGEEVVALAAPSIVGQFDGGVRQIVGAIKAAGFKAVIEVAVGADRCSSLEGAEFAQRMKAGDAMMGTSCCPAYTEAVKKHAKAFGRYVSHARTPMSYAAEYAKEKYPGAAIVFIGPCISKKFEGIYDAFVDNVLTFEELDAVFSAKGIVTRSSPEGEYDSQPATGLGRGFPVSRGVADAVARKAEGVEARPVLIDGLDEAGVRTLREYGESGLAPGNLVEVMCCTGGCVNGPGVVADPKISSAKLRRYLEEAGKQV
jgi:[FeFe] hydrogenase (group B1/B3)